MKSFSEPACKQAVLERIRRLRPDTPRQWGKMTAQQMLCHLTDTYAGCIGERYISPMKFPLPLSIVKWFVLRAPLSWPKGLKTRPELEQGRGGTPPTEFEADRAALLAVIERFCAIPQSKRAPHPIFGPLTEFEWMRWAYLHADHHLRQFGC